MRRAIRAAPQDGHASVAVVCGAWHVPALDLDAHPAGADAARLRGMPKVKVGIAWVPWTHRRLTSESGYGAGVESPGWYAHVFEHPGRDGVARFFVEAAQGAASTRPRRVARPPDRRNPPGRHAGGDARPAAARLSEVLDAADAVMGGLNLLRNELIVGDALGRVPPSAPQVPLARDLAKAQRSARLKPEAAARTVEVDLRKPIGLRRSHLLHRLLALGVPWGCPRRVAGRRARSARRGGCVGAGAVGADRRVLGVRHHGRVRGHRPPRRAVGRVDRARRPGRRARAGAAGRPPRSGRAERPPPCRPGRHRPGCRAADGRRAALANALRYGNVRGTDASSLSRVFDGIVVRIVAGVVPVCAALDDEAAARWSSAGRRAGRARRARPRGAARLLPGRAAPARRAAARARARPGAGDPAAPRRRSMGAASMSSAACRGRCRRARRRRPGRVRRGVPRRSRHGARPRPRAARVVDRWLSSLTPDAFDAVVALLRRTFGGFEPAERRQIMALLLGVSGDRHDGFGSGVDETRAALALVTVRHMLGLPTHDEPSRGFAAMTHRRPACPTPSGGGGGASSSAGPPTRRWPGSARTTMTRGAGGAAGGPESSESVLSGDDQRIDAALAALYDQAGDGGGRGGAGRRAGGLGRSRPGVVRWLGDIRRYFPTPVVRVLQRDAIERLDIKEMLLEPELLQTVEPDLRLVTMLVELNRVLPEETRATARQVIASVLADLERRLSDHTRQAVRGALARSARTSRPRPADIDWPHTISANLRHWIPERGTLVPERLVGHGRRQRSLARDVVIAVDQSGSMADSVVYASLFGGVLAQLPSLRTKFFAFDTSDHRPDGVPPRPGRGAVRRATRRWNRHRPRARLLPAAGRTTEAERALPRHRPVRGRQRDADAPAGRRARVVGRAGGRAARA